MCVREREKRIPDLYKNYTEDKKQNNLVIISTKMNSESNPS